MSEVPDLRSMLEDFHDKFEEEQRSRGQENQEFRRDLLEEEFQEFNEVIESEGFDEDSITEEMADMVYLLFGSAVCFDVNLYEVLVDIHEENMAKESLKTPEDYDD